MSGGIDRTDAGNTSPPCEPATVLVLVTALMSLVLVSCVSSPARDDAPAPVTPSAPQNSHTSSPVPPAGSRSCAGHAPTIVGSPGDDVIGRQPGSDVIVGLGGNDVIVGGSGEDIICGGGGNDSLIGLDDDDLLLGGPGDDGVFGTGGDDRLFGGAGNDVITSGGGAIGEDRLFGGPGNDYLHLNEGSGADVMNGGGARMSSKVTRATASCQAAQGMTWLPGARAWIGSVVEPASTESTEAAGWTGFPEAPMPTSSTAERAWMNSTERPGTTCAWAAKPSHSASPFRYRRVGRTEQPSATVQRPR